MKLQALDPFLYPLQGDALYGKSQFVDRFYELITDSIQPPYTISLDGLWGTGKTSMMTLLQDKLQQAHYPVFWFNPWEYRKTGNVVFAFLQCLAAHHKDILENNVIASGWKMLRVLIELGIDVGVTALTQGNFSREGIEKKFKEFEEKKTPLFQKYQNPIETIKKEFVELITAISKDYDDKPVVIFFDDLDRCLPDDTIELLEALKNLFVTPKCNCIFICGLDTHIAKKFIVEHYHNIEETFAIDYFRKIFNLTISMPYSPNIYELLCKQIQSLYTWEDPDSSKAKALANLVCTRSLQAQITSVRKHLNILTNFYTFLKFNHDYEFHSDNDFIINLLVLKEAWQPLYEELIQEALHERSPMERLIQGISSQHKDDGKLSTKQAEFLSEFLGQTSPFAQEDLSQWLVNYPTLA